MEAQGTCLDIISNLPSHIIEIILCRVELEEAARTSVLSKKWRYKWTKIPELRFFKMYDHEESTDEDEVLDREETIESERKKMSKRCKVLYTIYQILLMRQGPINEFTLYLKVDNTCFEINHILSYLSRNNDVKKLHLHLSESNHGANYWIPLSIFSLQHLTHLSLYGCVFNPDPTFNGFRSLTSLYLNSMYIPTKTLLYLLSNCPLLKTFEMLLNRGGMVYDDQCNISELFECLPMIESLTTWNWITEDFVVPPVSQELPIVSLIHLKYIFYTCMSGDALYFLAFLMRYSPNVEKIEIDIVDEDVDFCEKMMPFIVQTYSDMCLERLNELEIVNFTTERPKLEFVRFILAKSPNLKKVCLPMFREVLDENDKLQMFGFLLNPPPASPVAEITLW